MDRLYTTLGPRRREDLGTILPHEHVFVDLGPVEEPSHREATADEVLDVMAPHLERAAEVGVTALVECTPVGVGRRADILVEVSEATGMPLVVPTGIYREPRIPDWARAASEDDLADWMRSELRDGIEDAGVRAAWIKVAAGDEGLADDERTILRAAAAAGADTGALIGSHTTSAAVAHDQLDAIEAVGYDPERFVWIHAQEEADPDRVLSVADRGAWIEYDALGSDGYDDGFFLERIEDLLEAGRGDQLLLSHDRGWYDPSKPGGGTQRPYTYLSERFVPALRRAGVSGETIERVIRDNPYEAFSR